MESIEPGLPELIASMHKAGRLMASTDAAAALAEAEIVMVAVQTPTDADGIPRYEAMKGALAAIGTHLRPGMLVIVESTLAPGSMANVIQPALEEASGLRAGTDFGLGHCPERVMPGRLLKNLTEYDRVVGGIDEDATRRMMEFYGSFVEGELHATDMTTAEFVKSTENAYRDVEIAFANEVSRICEEHDVDVWAVRDFVNRVEGRNMHLPGTGVGGHCIPKDGLLLASAAKSAPTDMLRTARKANDFQPIHMARRIHAFAPDGPVAVLGASYLADSDDDRNTPVEPLVKELQALGRDVRVVDPFLPEFLGRPTVSLEEGLEGAACVVLATAHSAFNQPDWEDWGGRMAHRAAFDGRGVWKAPAGFLYAGVGKSVVDARTASATV